MEPGDEKVVDWNREWRRLGLVVDRCNDVDGLMADILIAYIKPAADREPFVERYLLHNSVISFGTKITLVLQIAKLPGAPKIDGEAIRKVGNLRNAVAHVPVSRGVRYNMNALMGKTGPYFVAETMQSGMRFTERNRDEVVLECLETALRVYDDLVALRDFVDRLNGPPPAGT